MALKRQLRADKPMLYVLSYDDAWDPAAIAKHKADYDLYFSGDTRYDLDQVKHMLDMEKMPIVFHIRQLALGVLNRIYDLKAQHFHDAMALAIVEGVTQIDNIAAYYSGYSAGRKLTFNDVELLADVLGSSTVWDVGAAVVIANADIKA